MKFLLAVGLLSQLCCVTLGANILAIFHIPSKSHHILGSALLKKLANKGHQVTMVSPYPFKDKVLNYRDIFIEEMLQYKQDSMQGFMRHNVSMIKMLGSSIKMSYEAADIVLSHHEIEKLKTEHFDLVIQSAIFSESFLGLAYHFKAQVILFSPVGSMTYTNNLVGNPSPPSYVPTGGTSIGAEMNFWERLFNTSLYLLVSLLRSFIVSSQEELLQKYFPEAPPLQDLLDNVALIFVNSHVSIESPRPYVPNMIQIGGFHVEEPNPLPVDIKDFLDGATNGAVFFSLGSNVKLSSLPDGKQDAIIRTLGRLNMRVFLKSEFNFTKLPGNIRVGRWLPQNDILGHPNVKLFISHGGLLSTTEAVYHAVPIIGIPIFGDQKSNIADAVHSGFAIKLEVDDLTEESLSSAIEEILTNPKYRTAINLKSSLLKAQPVKPMDLAVFWVEHVLKHKGAAHLRNAGVRLKWYQYYLIDVFLFVFSAMGATVLTIVYLVKLLWRKLKKQVNKFKVKTN